MKYKIDYSKEIYLDDEWISKRTAHLIIALKDFTCQGREIHKGDHGSWVENEENLSQEGDCWIFDGIVQDNARVEGNAMIDNMVCICDNAVVKDNAYVYGYSNEICGSSIIGGDTKIEFKRVENKILIDSNEAREEICNNSLPLTRDEYLELLWKRSMN